MKLNTFILLLPALTVGPALHTAHPSVPSSYECLTQDQAEKILGQVAKFIEHSTEVKPEVVQYKCTYTATASDEQTGKLGNVYFMLEVYTDSNAAHQTFAEIITSNAANPGQSLLTNIGQEAWYHTDGENFSLLIAREENKMLRVKVSKLTSKTSIDAMKKITAELLTAL